MKNTPNEIEIVSKKICLLLWLFIYFVKRLGFYLQSMYTYKNGHFFSAWITKWELYSTNSWMQDLQCKHEFLDKLPKPLMIRIMKVIYHLESRDRRYSSFKTYRDIFREINREFRFHSTAGYYRNLLSHFFDKNSWK